MYQIIVIGAQVSQGIIPMVEPAAPILEPVAAVLPVAEPVPVEVVPAPQTVAPSAKLPTPVRIPMPTLDQVKGQVWELFCGYLDKLDDWQFSLATDLRKKIQHQKGGVHNFIWVLEQLVGEGKTDKYIPEGVPFSWKENGQLISSADWDEVPRGQRATALLFALYQESWDEMQSRKDRTRNPGFMKITPFVPADDQEKARQRARMNGGAGAVHKTGKTERNRNKVKMTPIRVGPAKGTPGNKKKRA